MGDMIFGKITNSFQKNSFIDLTNPWPMVNFGDNLPKNENF